MRVCVVVWRRQRNQQLTVGRRPTGVVLVGGGSSSAPSSGGGLEGGLGGGDDLLGGGLGMDETDALGGGLGVGLDLTDGRASKWCWTSSERNSTSSPLNSCWTERVVEIRKKTKLTFDLEVSERFPWERGASCEISRSRELCD